MTFYRLERKQVFAIKQMGGAIHVLSCRKVHVMISGPSLNCLVSCLSPIIIFGWSRREWLGLRAGRDLRDFFLVLQIKKQACRISFQWFSCSHRTIFVVVLKIQVLHANVTASIQPWIAGLLCYNGMDGTCSFLGPPKITTRKYLLFNNTLFSSKLTQHMHLFSE